MKPQPLLQKLPKLTPAKMRSARDQGHPFERAAAKSTAVCGKRVRAEGSSTATRRGAAPEPKPLKPGQRAQLGDHLTSLSRSKTPLAGEIQHAASQQIRQSLEASGSLSDQNRRAHLVGKGASRDARLVCEQGGAELAACGGHQQGGGVLPAASSPARSSAKKGELRPSPDDVEQPLRRGREVGTGWARPDSTWGLPGGPAGGR